MLKSKAPGAAPLINAYLKPLFTQKDVSQRPSLSRGLKPYLLALAWVFCLVYFYRETLRFAFYLAAHNDDASHIFVVPLISAWLLYRDRKHLTILPTLDFRTPLIPLIPAILVLSFSSYSQSLNASERLAGLILSLVLFLQAGFIAIEGRNVARASWFGLAFLFLAVPLPDVVLNRVIYILQAASSTVAERLFDWSGVPVLREGFVFHLPRVSIEVAQECSGIRSSIALLILAILLSHFAFRKLWKKLVFIAAGLCIMVVKNGLRIVTLSLLASYVDPRVLYGRLHREGGIVFFLLALGLLLPVYKLLKRGEADTVGAK